MCGYGNGVGRAKPAAALLLASRVDAESSALLQIGGATQYASIYNLTSNTFKPFYIRELAFCGGHALLPDGRGLIVGGRAFLLLSKLLRLAQFKEGKFMAIMKTMQRRRGGEVCTAA